MKKKIVTLLYIISLFKCLYTRSPQRKTSADIPIIQIGWVGQQQFHELCYSHLQEKPFFHLFDKKHFMSHLIEPGPVSFRDNSGSITGTELSQLVAHLLEEVKQGKQQFTHFEILKMRDFNRRDKTGLIIVKAKQYPFVVKLFIETPESLVLPLSKGFEPTCFFMMGGGVNRHLNGFTRIKNLSYLRKRVAEHPHWRRYVDFPRKWFWLPEHVQWIEMRGINVGHNPQQVKIIHIPAVYALICDYIDVERLFSLGNKQDRDTALALSNYVQQNIDPHINNYGMERHTGLIVPLDTEHFPTMVGYATPPYCKTYLQWYTNLTLKMLKDCIGTTKKERLIIRSRPYIRRKPL
ncbi:MAG: hypothetical protein WCE21_02700 [Candidatus Babeliales bacterium]